MSGGQGQFHGRQPRTCGEACLEGSRHRWAFRSLLLPPAYTASMARLATPLQPELAQCNRAPAQLWLPHWTLSHCVRAMVSRST
ncbi:MAG: hypothetical protein ACK5X3_20970, partial [Pseudomonadota bacterium]